MNLNELIFKVGKIAIICIGLIICVNFLMFVCALIISVLDAFGIV